MIAIETRTAPMRPARLLATLLLSFALPVAAAEWQTVLSDQSRRVEIDRASIFDSDQGTKVSWGRVVLTAEEADSAGYATIKALNRYDCRNRSFFTIKRVYLDAAARVVREEAVADQVPLEVAPNSVDERMWREVCRPPTVSDLEKVASAAGRLAAEAQSADARSSPAAKPAKPSPIATRDAGARPMKAGGSAAGAVKVATPAAEENAEQPKLVLPPLPSIRPPRTEVPAEAKTAAREEARPGTKGAKEEPAPPAPRPAATRQLAASPAPGTLPVMAPGVADARTAPARREAGHAASSAPAARPRAEPRRLAKVEIEPAKAVQATPATVSLRPGGGPGWSYEGDTGPANWGRLRPDWKLCSEGTRQSPIDLRDGVAVDLAPVKFDYRATGFRITDTGNTLQVDVGEGMSMELRGRTYALQRFTLHRPSQERVGGMAHDMVAHFEHRDSEGRVAMLAVLLAAGSEGNALLQTLWNNLPLDKGRDYSPPVTIDLAAFLPASPAHYLYIGSLPVPPCTEEVPWVVMKTPVAMSAEQLAVFARLYPRNGRPIQPANGRLILESR